MSLEAIPPHVRRYAAFDSTGTFRFQLVREWDPARPAVAFVMLNPSMANCHGDDPTVRRCMSFARSWGFGSLQVVNLFAYRTAHPKRLREVEDPVGPDNDRYILAACRRVQLVVAAWGNWGSFKNRSADVRPILGPHVNVLGLTGKGQPCHPLYLPGRIIPSPWRTTDGPACAS